jgi:hypothetical protein
VTPVLATEVIRRASTALFDATNVRWSLGELVDYINDGQRQIILLRPDSNSVTASIKLGIGSKQSIPLVDGTDPNSVPTPKGVRFLRAVRNMGSDGRTPGRAIRECSRVALDNEVPDWHFANPAATVQHYIFDNIAPKTFYVYPAIPNPSNTYIEMVYSGLPVTVLKNADGSPTSPTDLLTLSDQYINALLDFVLARCYAKDASYAGNMARAQAHIQSFGASLSATMTTEFTAAAAQQATPTPAAAAQARSGG